MPHFGTRSTRELDTCDKRIKKVLNEAIKHYDFSVLKGTRGKTEQNRAYQEGASQLMFPHSKHNSSPSQAVDIVPYPVDWNDKQRFHDLNEVIKKACNKVGEDDMNWGFDLWGWDMPHYQLGR